MSRFLFLLVFAPCLWQPTVAAELTIPAVTAYLHPDDGGARVNENVGITGWNDSNVKVKWYGKLNATGKLRVSVQLQSQSNEPAALRMMLGNVVREVKVVSKSGEKVLANFGEFQITESGYHTFTLESLETPTRSDVLALVIDGPAANDAHFNLKPRRNAASVHLMYPIEKDVNVSAFYCEMTGLEDPLWTYYMACGWHRGYFGMQVNSATERRIIFSVWDSGGEAIDRDKVEEENRVQLVAKGDEVHSGSFGNEGTGGHSHLKFNWKTGEKQRFLVTAQPVSDTQTIFAGYYFRPDLNEWMLISSWKAPKEGKYLRGLYSFSENFVGRNGDFVRKALYDNQWIRTDEGQWKELTLAAFSHDATGKSDRLDRFMGVEEGQFFLSHGGFIEGFTKYGQRFERPESNRSPSEMTLPPLPPIR